MRLRKQIKHYECETIDGRKLILSQPYTKWLGIKIVKIKVVYLRVFKKVVWLE